MSNISFRDYLESLTQSPKGRDKLLKWYKFLNDSEPDDPDDWMHIIKSIWTDSALYYFRKRYYELGLVSVRMPAKVVFDMWSGYYPNYHFDEIDMNPHWNLTIDDYAEMIIESTKFNKRR